MNLQDPKIGEMPKLEQVIRGVKQERAKRSPGKRTRLPVTPEILLKLRGVWEASSKHHNSITLWAACCLCYFGFLRSGQITVPSELAYDSGEHLNFSDIAVDSVANPSMLKVRIKASKTDPFRQGVDIFIGKTDNKLCPVAAMTLLSYLAKRGNNEGMLFHYEDKKLLSQDRFVASVREVQLESTTSPTQVIASALGQLQQLGNVAYHLRQSRPLVVGKVQHTCCTSDCQGKN